MTDENGYPLKLEGMGTVRFHWGSITRDKAKSLIIHLNDNFAGEERRLIIKLSTEQGLYSEQIFIQQKVCTNYYQIESISYYLDEFDGVREAGTEPWGITWIDRTGSGEGIKKTTVYPFYNAFTEYYFGTNTGEYPKEWMNPEGKSRLVDMPGSIVDGQIILEQEKQIYTDRGMYRGELKDISLFCKKHGMTLISDEVHYEFIFNQAQHTVAASIAEEVGVMAATVISPGKSFNVPMLSGASLIIKDQKMRDKISAIMENLKYPFAHAFVEGVTIAAYTKSVEWLEAVKYYIQENKRIFKEYFETHFPQLKVVNSDSTYVMWVDCSGLNMSDAELEKFWRDDCKLILSHGSEFGTGYSQYRRFNVACSKLKLEEILERILKQMQKNKLI